ncbi:MAG: hypothetical protein HQL49_01655 [Gammaproteobacteria bacterium]|nr:hypothetical protein [Gammaproteobacteria bacterium]
MRHSIITFTLLSGIVLSQALFGETALTGASEQNSAVARLGELNGVALQCKYFKKTREIKEMLILHLPKQRAYGVIFDDESNRSFIDFMQNRRSCPESDLFSQSLETAYAALAKAFSLTATPSPQESAGATD